MADGRHQPGGENKDERDKQNELPSRATRFANYEKNFTLEVNDNQRLR